MKQPFTLRKILTYEHTTLRVADYDEVIPLFVVGTIQDLTKAHWFPASGMENKNWWGVIPFDQIRDGETYSCHMCPTKKDAIKYMERSLETARYA